MPDPSAARDVAIAVGSGVATEAIKLLTRPWVDQYFQKHGKVALAKAQANRDDFLAQLDRRLSTLEAESLSAETLKCRLEDPDVAATLHAAVLSAARTTSSDRHKILASAVAERLKAENDGVKAVASNLAVSSVPQLAASHLDWLGLLAVIYGIRATWLFPKSIQEGNWEAEMDAGRDVAASYSAWLEEQIAPYEEIGYFTEDTAAHLVASSVIVVDRSILRKLGVTMSPPRGPFSQTGLNMTVGASINFAPPIWSGWLAAVWEAGLQHARPTPAGLLIGCAAHDAKLGGSSVATWEWSTMEVSNAGIVENSVWDGDRIHSHFLHEMENALLERIGRGGMNWSRILGR